MTAVVMHATTQHLSALGLQQWCGCWHVLSSAGTAVLADCLQQAHVSTRCQSAWRATPSVRAGYTKQAVADKQSEGTQSAKSATVALSAVTLPVTWQLMTAVKEFDSHCNAVVSKSRACMKTCDPCTRCLTTTTLLLRKLVAQAATQQHKISFAGYEAGPLGLR
jgi:hypothetical protein